MLQWTSGYRYMFKILISFYPHICSEVKMLGYMVVLFLIVWGTSILFSILAAPIYIPINSAQVSPFLHSHQHLLFVVFSTIGILTHVRWYLIVTLICTSMLISDVEASFLCACWPSVCLLCKNECSLPLPTLKLGCLFFDVEWYECIFCILTYPLLDISFANIFSHLVGTF